MKMFKSVLILMSILSINSAAIAASINSKTTQAITAKLSKLGLEATQVKSSSLPNMAEVMTKQGLFYVSYDGNYILQGKLFGIENEVVDLTEESLGQVRLDGVKQFAKSMITYPAKNEKHVITVFTDITCGYCRKLHEQMKDYNDLGITVNYLAYPRAGIRDQMGNYTQPFKDLRSIWCNEDSATALTQAKSGSEVAPRVCELPIAEQYDFGRQIGVNGTPAIILENGMMMPGYRPPEQLAQLLNSL